MMKQMKRKFNQFVALFALMLLTLRRIIHKIFVRLVVVALAAALSVAAWAQGDATQQYE